MSVYLVKVPCANDCGEIVMRKIKTYCTNRCRVEHGKKERGGMVDTEVDWDIDNSIPMKTISNLSKQVNEAQRMVSTDDELEAMLSGEVEE
jgi:hypothetical protein